MTKPQFLLFFSPPSFNCLLKGTAWHFKSLLFCLSGHSPLWEFCPSGTLHAFLFSVICIEINVKQHACSSLWLGGTIPIHLNLFPSLQPRSLNVKTHFYQTGDFHSFGTCNPIVPYRINMNTSAAKAWMCSASVWDTFLCIVWTLVNFEGCS